MASELDELQQYLDGELSIERASAIELRLQEDNELVQEVNSLKSLNHAFTAYSVEQQGRVPSEELWAAVQRGISQEAESVPSVSESGFVRSPTQPAGYFEKFKRWLWVPILIGSTAAALGLVAFLWFQSEPPAQLAARGLEQASRLGAAMAPVARSEVVAVDFGENTGTVFGVDQEGVHSEILWLEEPQAE